MPVRWGWFSQRSSKYLKTGWLMSVGLVAVYAGWIKPLNSMRGIAERRATGLAGIASERVGWAPEAMWQQTSPVTATSGIVTGIVGGVSGGVQQAQMTPYFASTARLSPTEPAEDRKIVRTASMDVIVKKPAQAAEEVRKLADRLGGYLTNSQVSGSPNALSASISIRVPSTRFEECRAEIRRLGVRVDDERVEAQDMTKQYVDREARLGNLRAEEAQYRAILKQATTVKDTLEVSEKLNAVRGEIEQQQAEFQVLSKQIETVALNISLRAEADMQVFGLNWRPLFQLKVGARAGLAGLADYAASMTYFLFYLPTVLLWMMTLLLGAAAGWRVLRWSARLFFHPRSGADAAQTG